MAKSRQKTSIQDIKIQDFIFHVVHHGESEPKLMNKTPINGFEVFFKERIAEIIDGNKFSFVENSYFYVNIKKINNNESSFVDISKELAIQFHKDDERIKAGVMILMKAEICNKLAYILLKYDHAEVVAYNTSITGEAVLTELKNTFSKEKYALQKSAIIYINDDYVIVNDLSNRVNITRFFKQFLGVQRHYSQSVLTEKVRKSFLKTVAHFKDELPTSFTSQAAGKYYEIIQAQDSFNKDTFLDIAFGAFSLEKIEKVFDSELKKQDIYGENFEFDKNITPPKQKKFKTKEGVQIQFPTEAQDTIKIITEGNKSVITIVTEKLTEIS